MGHKKDHLETIRRLFARKIGGFLTGTHSVQTDREEFVGYVDMTIEEFEEVLHDMDFERNSLAYWKHIPEMGHEQGSWRWCEGDWQLHIVLYDEHYMQDNIGTTYIFAHWEYRWDRYPIKHIRGVGISDTRGVNMMRSKLNKRGISWYDDVIIPGE